MVLILPAPNPDFSTKDRGALRLGPMASKIIVRGRKGEVVRQVRFENEVLILPLASVRHVEIAG